MKKVHFGFIRYAKLFSNYEHSIPIIYSALEEQYPSHLYVDDLDNPKYGVLFTKFDYNFLCYFEIADVESDEIKQTIKEHINTYDINECIMFAPSTEGEKIIQPIFKAFRGVIDVRYAFQFDSNKFQELYEKINTDEIHLIYIKEDESLIDFPKCEMTINQQVVCFAKAFMIGNSFAEIDVCTQDQYRRKGYALACSIKLIYELINKHITPQWTSWEHNVSSHQLANKLGFQLSKKINAYIWVDEFGKI